MVYDARCFDALTDAEWDDERIRVAIREIVADADAAFDESLLWPAEEWDAWQTPTPLKSLYVGAAGVTSTLSSTGGVTVSAALPLLPPKAAPMVACPSARPVAMPCEPGALETVAALEAEDQVAVRVTSSVRSV